MGIHRIENRESLSLVPKRLGLIDFGGTLYRQDFLTGLLIDRYMGKGIIPIENQGAADNYFELLKHHKLPDTDGQYIGYEDFIGQALWTWALTLKGTDQEEVTKYTREILKTEVISDMDRSLIGYLNKFRPNYDFFIVSALPTYVTDSLVQIIGWQGTISSVFGVADGKFTGKLERAIVTKYDKQEQTDEIKARYSKKGSIAIGNMEVDKGMMSGMEHQIIIDGQPSLAEVQAQLDPEMFRI